jgi:AcrR family transcriptional regulator
VAERLFSILSMSSVVADDLTARARVRDAAVARFGRDGFGAPLRTIAADAGVSAALLIHHFGSKDGLRAACDEHVLGVIRENKRETVGGSATAMLQALAEVERFAPYAAYVVQALAAGGPFASSFLDHLVQDAHTYLTDGVAAGTLHPSLDERARARFLTLSSVGMLLLHLRLRPADPDDLAGSLRALSDEVTLPALELYSQGLFVDRTMLDAYLPYVPDPPGGRAPRPGAGRPARPAAKEQTP